MSFSDYNLLPEILTPWGPASWYTLNYKPGWQSYLTVRSQSDGSNFAKAIAVVSTMVDSKCYRIQVWAGPTGDLSRSLIVNKEPGPLDEIVAAIQQALRDVNNFSLLEQIALPELMFVACTDTPGKFEAEEP